MTDDVQQAKALLTAITNLIPEIKRLIALNRDIVHRYADLAEQAKGIFDRMLANEDNENEARSELVKELDRLSESIKRLDRLVVLDKTGNSDGQEAKKLRSDIQAEQEIDYLNRELIVYQNLLRQQMKTLAAQKLKAAKYGGYGNAPVELQNDIDSSGADVSETQAMIEALQGDIKRLEKRR